MSRMIFQLLNKNRRTGNHRFFETQRRLQSGSCGVCVDIDGVLVRGEEPFPAALEALRLLENNHHPTVFLTNGFSKMARKAEFLTDKLKVKVDRSQIVQAHTPLCVFEELKTKHCLVLGQGPIADIAAEDLGFTSVCTIEEMSSAYPLLDIVDHRKCSAAEHLAVLEDDVPRVEAIVVLGEPRHWETPLQLLIDLLLTNGKPCNNAHRCLYQTLPLVVCNPDLQYMGRSNFPRFGNGAFLLCLEALFKKLCGAELVYDAVVGKPSEISFRYAEHVLSVQARNQAVREPITQLYMIGDNAEVDIYGANLYQRCISSGLVCNTPAWRLLPTGAKLHPQTVRFVESILVETGVSAANNHSTAPFNHSHRDFIEPGNIDMCIPTVVVDNVLSAVKYILNKESVV